MSFASDPFSQQPVPKFREFDLSLFRDPMQNGDQTQEFAASLKALNQIIQPPPVYIPETAGWYQFNTVSDYERQFEFTNYSGYVLIRDFMVVTFRVLNSHYLPFTLCRRNIKAPANLIFRVWNFLNQEGLINYRVDESLKPVEMIPDMMDWPELVYFIDDRVYTAEQYENLLHQPPPKELRPNYPLYPLLCSPFVDNDQKPQSAEIPNLIGFGNWTQNELRRLLDAADIFEDSWDKIAQYVGRPAEECASTLLAMPISNYIHELKANKSIQEMKPFKELAIETALANDPSQRLVYSAVHAIENEKAKRVLSGEPVPPPKSHDEAIGIMALEKLRVNGETMKTMHKQRILDCLHDAAKILVESINEKEARLSSSHEKWESSSSSEQP